MLLILLICFACPAHIISNRNDVLENTFDRKRISTNSNPGYLEDIPALTIALTVTVFLKHNNAFGLTK